MYSPAQLQQKLFDLCKKCYEADKAYVEAKEQFLVLDDIKKIRFEQIVEKQSGDKVNYREHKAKISPEWGAWLKTYQQFRYEEQKARLMRDKYRRDWETCRSMLSTANQEMRSIPYEQR